MVRWGMVIDLNRCTACQSCTSACMFENNIPFPLPEESARGIRMVWNEFVVYEQGEYPYVYNKILPRPCMHCMRTPCVKVCPVGATYKSRDGLTMQRYDICIGCRMCVNTCPYSARTFNWFNAKKRLSIYSYTPNPTGQSVRPLGVAEKCVFCVHRLDKLRYDLFENRIPRVLFEKIKSFYTPGERVGDDVMSKTIEIIMQYHLNNEGLPEQEHYNPPLASYLPACVQTCSAGARIFGDLENREALVYKLSFDKRAFHLLEELGTHPNVIYLMEA